ncbi:C-type lectin domain family 17, member A-like [Channa argus]|uniref:C-type lectin domain family 17, member A-like n=1 Tax=Channa argus TaxID=215402 RepID=UPI003520FC6A
MSSDIYAKPDFSKKVRYHRKVEEDGGEWEEREVDIYENTDDIRDDVTDIQSQEERPQTQNHPPVHRKSFRGAALCLAVLCLLMAAGIIVLSTHHILVTLEKNDLEKKLNNVSHSSNQSQHLIKQLQGKTSGSNFTMFPCSHILCPEGWKKFGCSCYFKSTERKSWSESRRFCQDRGSDLVIINSKEEQDFVTELNQHEESWIGLWNQWSDTERKYQWKWLDGSQPTETFWATEEPQYTWSSYAACCDRHGRWRSEQYYYDKNWICEKKICCFL